MQNEKREDRHQHTYGSSESGFREQSDRKSEIGNRKSEIGNRKSEIGNRKSEIGNRKSEDLKLLGACPKCGSGQMVKNGHHGEEQEYKCKMCGYRTYTNCKIHHYSDEVKKMVLQLNHERTKYRLIKEKTGVSISAIKRWVKEFLCKKSSHK